MKKFKKLLALSFCLVVLTALISSCSKDDDNNGPREVEFKVTASSNASISTVVYSNAQGQANTLTSVTGSTWSTKVTANADVQSVSVGANATATDDSGVLRVQVLVNGQVVKESESKGKILTATATHLFID